MVMNGKRILFSALMTAMIGFVIGLGLVKLGQPDPNQLKFDTVTYRQWMRRYGFFGLGVGFCVGAGQEYLRQAKKLRDQEENQ